METYNALIEQYDIDPSTAFKIIQKLSHTPKGMSFKLYGYFTLLSLTNMSPDNANFFLKRHYDA